MIKRYVLLIVLVMFIPVLMNASKAPIETQNATQMKDEIFISEQNVRNVIDSLSKSTTASNLFRIERGAQHYTSFTCRNTRF